MTCGTSDRRQSTGTGKHGQCNRQNDPAEQHERLRSDGACPQPFRVALFFVSRLRLGRFDARPSASEVPFGTKKLSGRRTSKASCDAPPKNLVEIEVTYRIIFEWFAQTEGIGMKPTSRHLAPLTASAPLIVLSLSTVCAGWAQNSAPEQGHLLRYGAVQVSKLPTSSKAGAKLALDHYQQEDVAAFERAKARANPGALLGSGPVLGPERFRYFDLPRGGFMGMSFANSSVGAVPPDTQVAAGAGFV